MVGLYVSFIVASTCWCIRHGKRKTTPFEIMVDTVDPIALHMDYRTITSHTPLEITDLSQLAYDMLWLVAGIPAPLKNDGVSSSVGTMTLPTEWKKNSSKAPTRYGIYGYPLRHHDLSDPETSEANQRGGTSKVPQRCHSVHRRGIRIFCQNTKGCNHILCLRKPMGVRMFSICSLENTLF